VLPRIDTFLWAKVETAVPTQIYVPAADCCIITPCLRKYLPPDVRIGN